MNIENEFTQAMKHYEQTGECLTGNDFLINQVYGLVNRSEKQFWIVVRNERPDFKDILYSLSRDHLSSLLDDLQEYHFLPSYKKLEILGIQTEHGRIKTYN